MKITILGTRGEVKESAPGHARHSGVLVDETILLDLGEREFLNLRPKAAFVTHLHPDHAFFILDPAAAKIDIPIYAPEGYEGMKIAVPSHPVAIGSWRVTPFPTHHSIKVKSQGYIIEKGGQKGQKLVYTGDVVWINKEHHHLLGEASLIITDGSLLRKGGRVVRDRETGQIHGHNGVPDLINLFRRFTRNVLFIHFGSWFYEDVPGSIKRLEGAGEKGGVRVLVGRDGMQLDLRDLALRDLPGERKAEPVAGWLEGFKDRRPR